jgi:hypothetical protein
MEYGYEIAWLCLWPLVLYFAWKMSVKNILKLEAEDDSSSSKNK